jgi:hypothetical protein
MSIRLELRRDQWSYHLGPKKSGGNIFDRVGDLMVLPTKDVAQWITVHEVECSFTMEINFLERPSFTGFIHLENEEDAMLFKLTWL